jgi:bacteriorhodopsin
MEFSKTVQGVDAGALALFSAYLISRMDVEPWVIAIPAISSIKYTFISQKKDEKDSQWPHYLSWFLTTPIMLLLIFSLNKVSGVTVGILLFLNQLMIASGYLATVSKKEEDVWFWFTLGCLAFLPILYELLTFSNGVPLVLLTLVTWSLYPIVWYTSRTNLIDKPAQNIAYSLLDFVSKAGLVTLYLAETGRPLV